MKKVAAFTAAGVTAFGMAVALPIGIVYAQSDANAQTFAQELAAKLGLSETRVQEALEALRAENQVERQAAATKSINDALTAGKITQRQADLLRARMEIQPEVKVDRAEVREDLAGLTAEQRQTKMEQLRAAHEAEVIKALNEKGLNVTQAEWDELQKVVRDSDLLPLPGKPRGFRKF